MPELDPRLTQSIVNEVGRLDPELLEHPDTRQLVELGAEFGAGVTAKYGTPDQPHWARGEYETGPVLMGYHNGGEDGHTSVGPLGAGVPRNVLMITNQVNEVAGREVYAPIDRAMGFAGAEVHDDTQLCGRSLRREGQGPGRGDERISGATGRDRYVEDGGDPVIGARIERVVGATAFNPETKTQSVDYQDWHAEPDNPQALRDVLDQEAVAGADLLNPIGQRGPLSSIELAVERLGLSESDHILQERLAVQGIDPASIITLPEALQVIGDDPVLRDIFGEIIGGESTFYRKFLKYSDEGIRSVSGVGIDGLFPATPGRERNARIMDRLAEELQEGATPLDIWQSARRIAGYPED